MTRKNISSFAYPLMAYLDRRGLDMAIHKDSFGRLHPAILTHGETVESPIGIFLFPDEDDTLFPSVLRDISGMKKAMVLPIASKDFKLTFKDSVFVWETITDRYLFSLTETLTFSKALNVAIKRLERYKYFANCLSEMKYFPVAIGNDHQLGLTLNDPESEFFKDKEMDVCLIRPLALEGKPWQSMKGDYFWKTRAKAQGINSLDLIKKGVTKEEFDKAVVRLGVPSAEEKPNTIWLLSLYEYDVFYIKTSHSGDFNKNNTRIILVGSNRALADFPSPELSNEHGHLVKRGWIFICTDSLDSKYFNAVQILLTTMYGARIWDQIVHCVWSKNLINPYDYHNKTNMIKAIS